MTEPRRDPAPASEALRRIVDEGDDMTRRILGLEPGTPVPPGNPTTDTAADALREPRP